MTASIPSTVQHGTINAYMHYGCRCEKCRAANTGMVRAQKQKRIEILKADPTAARHGVRATYVNYGCRCEKCRAANAQASRRASAAWYSRNREKVSAKWKAIRAAKRASSPQ
jgi:hypothetical protein